MSDAAARRDRLAGVLGALVIHVGLFRFGSLVLAQPAEYGIDPGRGGMAIDLVAAPPGAGGGREEGRSDAPATAAPEPESVAPAPDAVPQGPTRGKAPGTSSAAPSLAVGDGSSAAPGADPITFHSDAGGYRYGNPGYLRNPAPLYPLEARRLGQAGVVVLVVRVNLAGRPTSVGLKQGSGFPLLDESALTAVRQWRFRPAWLGGVAMESTVEVPIRFVLADHGATGAPSE